MQTARKRVKPGRLLIVANGNVSLERGLVAEEFVVIGLVRADGDVERRVQIHPGQVASVVVVREKRAGAQRQKILKRRVIGEGGSFQKQAGGLPQFRTVSAAVGHDAQTLVLAAPDHPEETYRLPLVPLADANRAQLKKTLQALGLVKA